MCYPSKSTWVRRLWSIWKSSCDTKVAWFEICNFALNTSFEFWWTYFFFSVSLGCGGSSSDNNTYIVQTSTTSSPSGTSNSCTYTICPCSTDICRIRYDFTTMVLASQQTSTPVAAGVATDSKNLMIFSYYFSSFNWPFFFQTLLLEIALRISFPSLHQVPLVHLPFVDTIPVNTWSSTLLDLSVKMSMLLLEPVQQPHGNGISTWHKYNTW